jgi:putative membrane protein
MKLIVGWLVLAGAVMVTVVLVPGIEVDWSPGMYMAIAAVFALVNVTLGVVLRLVSLPLLVLTLGLFSFVLNAVLFLVTDRLVDSLEVDSFWAALSGAVVIACVAAVIEGIARRIEAEPVTTP